LFHLRVASKTAAPGLTFEIDDTPGQLATISRIIGEAANVVEVIQQRMMQSETLKGSGIRNRYRARDIGHVRDCRSAARRGSG
jgi:threonine dehydratase